MPDVRSGGSSGAGDSGPVSSGGRSSIASDGTGPGREGSRRSRSGRLQGRWGRLEVMKVGAGLSMDPVAPRAATEAALSAGEAIEGRPADLAVAFASVHHADEAERILDAVYEAASPAALIGCVGDAVVGGAREVESDPAVSVWLASFPGGAETFHMQYVRTESGCVFAGWRVQPEKAGGPMPVHLMICDPFTFPADLLLTHLNEALPGAIVVGGNASGGAQAGQTILFQDRRIHREGAVGVRLPASIGVRTLVSQGCRPIDEYKAEQGTGDFLIRGVIGADPDTGAIAVGEHLEVGQTLRFHVRDAATADEELRTLLEREVGEMRSRPAGALLFTCNGRGSRLFPTPDHDARLVSSYLGGLPLAGFFCAGELGPVGGKNFVHGFTASLAVFLDDDGPRTGASAS